MSSGIAVNEEITILFNDMKLRSTHKWAVFKIKDKKEIIVDAVGEPLKTTTREEDRVKFVEMRDIVFATGEPRYILYDFSFKMAKDSRDVSKLAFIFFCPDDSKIGIKMIYASSKDSLKKQFTGLGAEFQANDKSDLDYDDFANELERKA